MTLLIRAPRVVSGERGEPEQALAIRVSDGRIEALTPVDTPATARTVLELGPDVVVLPGLMSPRRYAGPGPSSRLPRGSAAAAPKGTGRHSSAAAGM